MDDEREITLVDFARKRREGDRSSLFSGRGSSKHRGETLFGTTCLWVVKGWADETNVRPGKGGSGNENIEVTKDH